jgi:hypothetical protein
MSAALACLVGLLAGTIQVSWGGIERSVEAWVPAASLYQLTCYA